MMSLDSVAVVLSGRSHICAIKENKIKPSVTTVKQFNFVLLQYMEIPAILNASFQQVCVARHLLCERQQTESTPTVSSCYSFFLSFLQTHQRYYLHGCAAVSWVTW